MKGLKRKSVDTKEELKEEIKDGTSQVSEFSEEEDNEEIVGFANILQGDVFEKAQGDSDEKRIRNVREDGRKQRGHDEGQKDHDQEGKSSGQKEASSKEKSISKSEVKEDDDQEEKEVVHFKHGIPKEISVFVTAKVSTLPYENIDISNGITLTLPPNADRTTAALARAEAYEYCENFIALKVAEVRKALAGTKK